MFIDVVVVGHCISLQDILILYILLSFPPASKCPLVTVAMGRRTSIFMHLTDSEILKWPARAHEAHRSIWETFYWDCSDWQYQSKWNFSQFPNTQRERHDMMTWIISLWVFIKLSWAGEKNTSKLFNDLSIQLNNEYANIDWTLGGISSH